MKNKGNSLYAAAAAMCEAYIVLLVVFFVAFILSKQILLAALTCLVIAVFTLIARAAWDGYVNWLEYLASTPSEPPPPVTEEDAYGEDEDGEDDEKGE